MKVTWSIMKIEKIMKFQVCSHLFWILSQCTARSREDWKIIYFMRMLRLTLTLSIWCLLILWALTLTLIRLEHWRLHLLLMVSMIILIWHQLIKDSLIQTKENKSFTIMLVTLDSKAISGTNYRTKTFKWAPSPQTMSTATTLQLSLKMQDSEINIR